MLENISVRRTTQISIPTALIDNAGWYGGQAVRAYLVMALLEHEGKACTIQNYADKLGVARKTAGQDIHHLVAKNCAYLVAGHRSGRIPDSYRLKNRTPTDECYSLEAISAQHFLQLSPANLSLFLFLRLHCTVPGGTIVSQTALAQALGCSRSVVSKRMLNLKKKGFILSTDLYVDKIVRRKKVEVLL